MSETLIMFLKNVTQIFLGVLTIYVAFSNIKQYDLLLTLSAIILLISSWSIGFVLYSSVVKLSRYILVKFHKND